MRQEFVSEKNRKEMNWTEENKMELVTDNGFDISVWEGGDAWRL